MLKKVKDIQIEGNKRVSDETLKFTEKLFKQRLFRKRFKCNFK